MRHVPEGWLEEQPFGLRRRRILLLTLRNDRQRAVRKGPRQPERLLDRRGQPGLNLCRRRQNDGHRFGVDGLDLGDTEPSDAIAFSVLTIRVKRAARALLSCQRTRWVIAMPVGGAASWSGTTEAIAVPDRSLPSILTSARAIPALISIGLSERPRLCDGVWNVTFGAQRRRRGVCNLWEGEALGAV